MSTRRITLTLDLQAFLELARGNDVIQLVPLPNGHTLELIIKREYIPFKGTEKRKDG